MTGALTELPVAGRVALVALGKRLLQRVEPTPERAVFRREREATLAALPKDLVADHALVELDAREVP